jgi:hypothetical protein
MTEALDFNRIAAIAASLQELNKDRSAPIAIEGDVIVERPDGSGIDFLDMDEGEAARRVVEKVIEHPYFQEMMAERDQLWEALKWLAANVEAIPIPPNEHIAVIDSAIDASGWDEDHPVTP